MNHKSTEERRKQISDALLSVMAERGYAKASITRIADAAGLTPGLIHYHFGSKQAILLDVLERLVEAQWSRLDARLVSLASPSEQIEALLDAFLAVGEDADPAAVAAWVTISAEAIRQPEVQVAFEEAVGHITARISDILEAGVAAGEFDLSPPSTEACAAAILALIQGFFSLAATARQTIPPGSAAPAARSMVAGLLAKEDNHDPDA